MKKTQSNTAIKDSRSDRILYTVINIFLVLILLIVLYPIIYVVSSSFSSGIAVSSGRVLLLPVDFSLDGYRMVFSYKSVWTGLRNSLIYTFFGTAFNMFLTMLAAYPLARKNFKWRGFFMTLFIIVMIFHAGMIPRYVVMSKLHLVNKPIIMVLLGGISVYNLIIMRTYFSSSIPGELYEAACLDGCNEFRTFWDIVIPLSKPVISVIILYYAVSHWNSYFSAMLYLRKTEYAPLQLILRNILIASKINLTEITDSELLEQATGMADVMKHALIVVTSLPVIILYPFVQKFFQKGVMIGSVKG